jgi:L-seryl-tRNA(Ser) seleniumtransferase
MAPNVFRNIPSVNDLLEHPRLKTLAEKASRNVVVSGVRSFLAKFRQDVQDATADLSVPSPGELAEQIARWITSEERAVLRPVINATGVLLHTGLGRAPLAEAALEEIRLVASGYSSLEINLESGERSQRVQCVQKLLAEVTGAEAAFVVNNNAGATMVTLAALSGGREAIVSRGHLIEIGGSYRLPEVMSVSGARLREVGTTNKTRIGDYESAIGEETGVLMNVHRSNFQIVGFTEEASLAELARLGRKHRLPVIDDIGSGSLVDLNQYGIEGEPVAANSIKAGADVVLFSGDKLLGGPQCGVILGRRDLIAKIAQHPMSRALRVDKLTLAALAATLRLYRDDDNLEETIPFLTLLSAPIENLRNRAERLAPQIAALDLIETAEAVEETCYLGGGSVPSQSLPTWCISVAPAKGSVTSLARAVRMGTPGLVGRIKQDRLLIDLRTVFPREDVDVVGAFLALDGEKDSASAESTSAESTPSDSAPSDSTASDPTPSDSAPSDSATPEPPATDSQ